MDIETKKALIGAAATIISAFIVSVVGSLIASRLSRERDRQIREKEWIDQATALTKIDVDRKLSTWSEERKRDMRPPIEDFLAYYRDLKRLDKLSPGELYEEIREKHLAQRERVPSITESVERAHLIVEE